jgi:hypothetical protein
MGPWGLGKIELDLLVVLERLEALGLDRGEVDEDVLAPPFRKMNRSPCRR